MLYLMVITALALLIAKVPAIAERGLGSLPLAIILGMAAGAGYRAFISDAKESPDRSALFCQQKLLRLGIILLGFSLTFQQVAQLGWQVLLIDVVVICTVLTVGILLGIKVLGMNKELAVLTSVGSAVCGAAAIMATEPVVKGGSRQVSVAVATVVLFGTLSLIAYPMIFSMLPVTPEQFGVFIGSTVHEVAQAVAAGQTISPEALQTAIMTKLIRVMCLAPVVVTLSLLLFRDKQHADKGGMFPVAFPHFITFFILAVVVNSLITLPENLQAVVAFISQFSLTIAMAAMGFNTRWSNLRRAGIKPILLAAVLFMVLFGTGLGLNLVLYA